MGDIEPSENTLYKTKQTRNSTLSYRVGLDPVTTPYTVGSLNGPATSLARSYLTT